MRLAGMRRRRGIALALVALLALPSAAAAHAYLVRTVPAASVVLEAPPASIQLTYDEAVEPRLAIISVTDEQGARRPPARRIALRRIRTRSWCRSEPTCPRVGT